MILYARRVSGTGPEGAAVHSIAGPMPREAIRDPKPEPRDRWHVPAAEHPPGAEP